ncbi:hypothetical protein TWF694_003126 [Orbilia ellipsospora]|uniref:Uncharacterized protein n=1 Tax=Orbilia ellipsospora TaxID=2528407 RepID=A0AAV9X0Z9_9PEZI
MVLSIPPPTLTTLLPPFLSHIPASFASPHPPPSLPPLLTPLLRSRLTHLSTTSSNWLTLLTWSSNPSDGENLHSHLSTQDYYFLHQPPSPATYTLKGFRRLDAETLQCLILIQELEIIILYQFVADDIVDEEGERGDGWKVHDVRISDDEECFTSSGVAAFVGCIEEAEEGYRSRSISSRYTSTVDTNTIASGVKVDENEDEDEDDYWGRYDDEDTESSAGDQYEQPPQQTEQQHRSSFSHIHQSPVQLAASMLARRVLHPEQETEEDKEEEEYYARYANVEAVLDKPPAAARADMDRRDSISTTHTTQSNERVLGDLNTPSTRITIPSAKISPTVVNNTAASNPRVGERVVGELESAAQVHTQNEVAIQQHVSTSIKSLYRLWKAGGMEAEEFGKFLEREVEVLRVVEEAGGLGS